MYVQNDMLLYSTKDLDAASFSLRWIITKKKQEKRT
jgi:hypothetical protein